MVKKMWEMFCKRDTDGPRRHVTKGAFIMDNRPSVSSFTSRYNHFLFAPICEEANGMRLSVLSALARMDVDPCDKKQELRMGPHASCPRSLYHQGYGPVVKLCPPADVRAIANWSNEQRHSSVCTARDGPHRLDRACIGSQLPKLPDKESSHRGHTKGEYFVQRRRAFWLLD